MKYQLYESSGFVGTCPAFAESDDFDALRLWAIDHNDWKGKSQGAVIASDAGRSGTYVGTVRRVKRAMYAGGPAAAHRSRSLLSG